MSSSVETCTTCPYCGVGCGVITSVTDHQVKVSGDKSHPANQGRLCIKGSSLAQTLQKPGRLLTPSIEGRQVTWPEATAHVAAGLQRIRDEYGPQAIGLYLSGQLLTEDYYVANKFAKGFLGTGNVDTNSRLCMSSAVAAHKRAFGEDLVPGCYEDIELADLVLLVGSNMAYTHPVVLQRLLAAKKARPEMFIVVLDPRRTATCEMADLHLPLAPGSDNLLFNGLLHYLAREGQLDQTFIDNHTYGFTEALAEASQRAASLAAVASGCDVEPSLVEALYSRFASTERVVSVFCQGINQSGAGSDGGNAIINCHLATGKIGKPGASPFSITGQPNAMGGREVGGLANTLAAHMDFTDPGARETVKGFWQAPNLVTAPGLKAVDMMEAVHAGKIKALWIMATNPAVSMPDANFVKEALQRCELLIVSDCYGNTDTAQLANVLLPASTWGEKSGTVTNSERCISLQQGFMPAPGEARPDWQIVSQVARQMGYGAAFDYHHPAAIFREHAALSGLNNQGQRIFNIADQQHLSDEAYMAMRPWQWPGRQARLFSDGQYATEDGRARFVPVAGIVPTRPTASHTLVLNSGRLRDQWHTMTRTGQAPLLFKQVDEPFIEIHPRDAAQRQLQDRQLATVHNPQASLLARVKISEQQRPGEVFMPIHWSEQYASSARVSALAQRQVDPVSGQPQFKRSHVSVEAFPTILEGILLLDQQLANRWQPKTPYWSRVAINNGFSKYCLASHQLEQSLSMSADLRSDFTDISSWIMLSNHRQRGLSLAGFIGDRLSLVLFTAGNHNDLPDTAVIENWLGNPVPLHQRFRLLESTDNAGIASKGPIICSCHQVGQFEIDAAIEEGADSIERLGQRLKCGTNCGSCIPELQQRLHQCSKTSP